MYISRHPVTSNWCVQKHNGMLQTCTFRHQLLQCHGLQYSDNVLYVNDACTPACTLCTLQCLTLMETLFSVGGLSQLKTNVPVFAKVFKLISIR